MYVELPEVGSSVEKGSTFGVVESVKVRRPPALRPARQPGIGPPDQQASPAVERPLAREAQAAVAACGR